MKLRIITIAVLLAVVLSGCIAPESKVTQSPTSTSQLTPSQSEPDWTKWIDARQDEIADWMYLPNGGILVLYDVARLIEKESDPVEGPFYRLLQAMFVNGKVNVTEQYLFGQIDGCVAIFYDENWTDNLDRMTYLSSFRRIKDPLGNESAVMIVVTPNHSIGIPYQESDFYNIEPSDSLNSEPMKICLEDWELGDPFWFYVVPLENITEDYELRYGNYVLTGADILSGSWSIADAPIMPYPGYGINGEN